jgi:hypothetical protein
LTSNRRQNGDPDIGLPHVSAKHNQRVEPPHKTTAPAAVLPDPGQRWMMGSFVLAWLQRLSHRPSRGAGR